MKKLISVFMAAVMALAIMLTAADATSPSFSFALTTDKESCSPGDTVSVTLTLARTDVSDTSFTLYSVQDYILYDTSRLRLEAVDTSESGFDYRTYENQPGAVGFFRYSLQAAGVSVSNPLTIAVLTFTALDVSGTAALQNTRIEVGTKIGNTYQSVATDAEITVFGTARATKMQSAQVADGAAMLTFDNITTPGWLTLALAYSEDGQYLSCVGSAYTTGQTTLTFPLSVAENAAYIKFIVLDKSTLTPVTSAFTMFTGGASE